MNFQTGSSTSHWQQDVDAATFRKVLGRFVTGVTVVTTCAADGTLAGVTISSFNTLSLDPPLVLWSLALQAPSLMTFRGSEHFAVNVLAREQGAIAQQFAKASRDKFHGISWSKGRGGIPLIDNVAAQFECKVEQRYPGGDHELVIGRVLEARDFDHSPLVFGLGQFGDFSIAATEGKLQT